MCSKQEHQLRYAPEQMLQRQNFKQNEKLAGCVQLLLSGAKNYGTILSRNGAIFHFRPPPYSDGIEQSSVEDLFQFR
jgi:hypothetical protein